MRGGARREREVEIDRSIDRSFVRSFVRSVGRVEEDVEEDANEASFKGETLKPHHPLVRSSWVRTRERRGSGSTDTSLERAISRTGEWTERRRS